MFIYCSLVSTGWQWAVNQTCKCFAKMGTTMKMQWSGHVTSTANIGNVHMILIEQSVRKKAQDRPRRRRPDDLKLLSQRNKTLTYLTRAFVSTAMHRRGSLQSGHFLKKEVTKFFFPRKVLY